MQPWLRVAAMQQRLLAAAGLALGGISQLSYGVLMGGSSFWATIQFAEGAGLLLASVALARAARVPDGLLVAALVVAAVAPMPWFTRITGFGGAGPLASLASNTGSVVVGIAAVAWVLGLGGASAARRGVQAGLGLEALGGLVWVTQDAGQSAWTWAYLLAFLGFAAAAWWFPADAADAATSRPMRATS